MFTVIGCGNLNRSDDGVGVVIARRLADCVAHDAHGDLQIFDAGTGGMDVMFRARGSHRLVLVDASRSGSVPGTIFQVPGEELARDYKPSLNLHDFRWDHALYAGRRIFGADFPSEIAVFLIEAATLDLGTELSEPVQRAAERVIHDIEALIAQHVAQRRARSARIARGSIYLDSALCNDRLANITSVAALNRDGQALLLPLRGSSAGGLLLKLLNSRGDRIVHAEEFLRTFGIEPDTPERQVAIRWSDEAAGFILDGLSSAVN